MKFLSSKCAFFPFILATNFPRETWKKEKEMLKKTYVIEISCYLQDATGLHMR